MRISDWSSDVCSSDLAAALAQELLHDAIFQRVEGDHGEPAAGAEQRLGGRKAALQLAQLVVHVDAQGLEGARRGVDRPTFATRALLSLGLLRSEEHTSELQSLMRISYAVFCLKKQKQHKNHNTTTITTLK